MVPPDTPRDVAIDVFIKLNTQFVKLTAFDIVVAQLEAAVGEPLHEMVATLASEVPKLDDYAEPSDLVLAGGALLQERLPNQRGYLSLDLQQFSDDWPHLVTGAKGLVQFLEEEQVIDGARLPTQSVLAPLIALWSQAPESPDAKGNVRILLRKYLWSAFFTDRYDHSVPTSALQDYRALKSLVSDPSAAVSVPCLDRDEYPLPHEDLLMRARWPRYKDRLARALLLLSLRGGAEDLADGASVSRENIRQREYHHLFPIATMEDRELEEQDAHRALNCVLVTWRTNRKIAAKAPVTYLLERADASELGQTEIQRRLESHFLDYDLLSAGDYAAFLRGRAKACAKAIAQLCDGHCWHP